ncbi:hypothetical protein BDQ94DRAFT_163963 [Aspergillus welwitschiae]|uniref:Uncharacterized protein n=1 Tax=Aspergillus welwitschiae TaxID=1341132 RepID=A0A3F3PJE2_9EURO|nr:hypothetical protein BDQ94DRAFT_163963 [Aspergillus welwitschiae]RDH27049.1 hypothetical protein BDQ94DRAFT_163963 [Aspergillus welwitschiae]
MAVASNILLDSDVGCLSQINPEKEYPNRHKKTQESKLFIMKTSLATAVILFTSALAAPVTMRNTPTENDNTNPNVNIPTGPGPVCTDNEICPYEVSDSQYARRQEPIPAAALGSLIGGGLGRRDDEAIPTDAIISLAGGGLKRRGDEDVPAEEPIPTEAIISLAGGGLKRSEEDAMDSY